VDTSGLTGLQVTGTAGVAASSSAGSNPILRVTVVIGFSRRLGPAERLVVASSAMAKRGGKWTNEPLRPSEEKQALSRSRLALEFNLGNSGTIDALEIRCEVFTSAGAPVGAVAVAVPAQV
jgi:hypothetical protein